MANKKASVDTVRTGIEEITTQGDLLYRGASDLERLPKGTSGQTLKMGSSNEPEWTTVASPESPAWTTKSSGTVSSVASLDITGLTKTTQVIISNSVPATDSGLLYSRMSTDNGSSWHGDNCYRWDLQWARDNANTAQDSGSGGYLDSIIRMGLLTGNQTGENESITYTIYSPASTTLHTTVTWQGSIIEHDAQKMCVSTNGSGYFGLNTNAVNGLRFYYSNGNISTMDYIVLELN